MAKMSRQAVLDCLGSPDRISSDLEAFSRAAHALSSDRPRLIDSHAGQWVGVFGDGVAVCAVGYEALMSKLDAQGIPAPQTIVRFIDKTEKTFLL